MHATGSTRRPFLHNCSWRGASNLFTMDGIKAGGCSTFSSLGESSSKSDFAIGSAVASWASRSRLGRNSRKAEKKRPLAGSSRSFIFNRKQSCRSKSISRFWSPTLAKGAPEEDSSWLLVLNDLAEGLTSVRAVADIAVLEAPARSGGTLRVGPVPANRSALSGCFYLGGETQSVRVLTEARWCFRSWPEFAAFLREFVSAPPFLESLLNSLSEAQASRPAGGIPADHSDEPDWLTSDVIACASLSSDSAGFRCVRQSAMPSAAVLQLSKFPGAGKFREGAPLPIL